VSESGLAGEKSVPIPSEPPLAEIGIIGGSGFYSFLDDCRRIDVDTPFGPPSDSICLAEVQGRSVAFLARHGQQHAIPAHKVNYRANIWALRKLGVERLISPCASGSLRPEIGPGEVVVCDQIIDKTKRRADTFFDGPETVHVGFADPYCPQMRQVTSCTAGKIFEGCHDKGTVVVIEGPRFSTRAESSANMAEGWSVVSMTPYPEAVLAREQRMCSVNISLITDFDCAVSKGKPASALEVIETFKSNMHKLQEMLVTLIPQIPVDRSCNCASLMDSARV